MVSDAFLLEVAGIAASLLGFFVVGVFFFVQRGLFPQTGESALRYMQAATAAIMTLYAMTLLVSLALVAVPVSWAALTYLVGTIILLSSVWRLHKAVSEVHRVLPIRVMSRAWMWLAPSAVAVLPWAIGGLDPSRDQITLAIGATGIVAFASTASLVLSAFEISSLEATVRDRPAATPIEEEMRSPDDESAPGDPADDFAPGSGATHG
jgi:hypothetical protein